MRIGFEAKRLFLNSRGLGNYARNLLYGLIKYHSSHEYHLYTPNYSETFINTELINLTKLKIHQPNGLKGISAAAWRSMFLGSVARKNTLDVFHGLAQELPKDIKKSNAKSIVTIHDMIFLKHPEFYKFMDRKIYYNKVKFSVHHSDYIIAISEQTKNDIVNTFNISENKISVIYQSCNEVFYEKRTSQELEVVRKKWNLPKEYILYVGALNENKNVKIILKALNMLKGKFDLPLVIVGKGKLYKQILQKYAAKHGLSQRLIFASEIANPVPLELSSFYQLASVFIFPSFYEGFGIPILEARFSETPVIASNSSCLQEVGEKSSLYFNPNNAEELANHLLHLLPSKNMKSNISSLLFLKGSTKKLNTIYTTL